MRALLNIAAGPLIWFAHFNLVYGLTAFTSAPPWLLWAVTILTVLTLMASLRGSRGIYGTYARGLTALALGGVLLTSLSLVILSPHPA